MGMCCETRRPRRQRRWTSLTRMDSSFPLLTRAGHPWRRPCLMGLVDERRTPPTVGCRTRETELGVREDTARPRVIRWGIDSGGAATRGAAVLRLQRRPAHGRKTQLGPGCATSVGELLDVKRPVCLYRQTGAWRGNRPATHPSQAGHGEGAARLRVSHAAGVRSRSGRQTCLQEAGALRPTK